MVTFAEPSRLGLLAVVAALGATYVLAQRRRPHYALRFTTLELLETVAPHRPGFRRHLPACVVLTAIITMVLGLARPARTIQVARRSGTVVVAIDVSPSMMATDVSPTRLAAAQTAVGRFSDLVPSRIRIVLVTFAGTAQVLVPPTSDHVLIRKALARLQFRSETSLGEAIHASLEALATASATATAAGVVVLSDGASTTGRRARVHDRLRNPVRQGGPRRRALSVPPEPTTLQRIAAATGGRFFEAASSQELTSVYSTIGASVTTSEERRDLTTWFLAAFALVVIASALSLVWFSRVP